MQTLDWLVDYMERTGLNGLVYELNGLAYDFSVDCDATDIDDIKDIPKYLMKKNDIVKYVRV